MIYDYRCSQCGTDRDDVYNKIADRNSNAPVCCDKRMALVHKVPPYGWTMREMRYICPVTNEGVTSRRQRRNIMAREELVDVNDLKRTSQQRIDAKAKKTAELKAIKDAIPKDLSQHFTGMEKQAENAFLAKL